MPRVGTQLDSYFASVEKAKRATEANLNELKKVEAHTQQLIEDQKRVLRDGLQLTIGFTKGLRRCFLAYYDYAIQARLVLDPNKKLNIDLWCDWKKHNTVVAQYECDLDLSKHMRLFIPSRISGISYQGIIVMILQQFDIANEFVVSDITIENLYNYINSNSLFRLANPADYLGDITDEE